MSSKSREFEKLITRIEKRLSPIGAKVKSPDMLVDRTTGQLREVDASIRYQIGSAPILITIECRDHQDKQDITWLEQIKTKRESIGANQTIVVSKAGFYEPAKKFAALHNLLLRQISDVTDEFLLQCCKGLQFFADKVEIDHLTYRLAFYREPEDIEKIELSDKTIENIEQHRPFAEDAVGNPVILQELLDLFYRDERKTILSDLRKHGKSKFEFEVRIDKGLFYTDTTVGKRSILGVLFVTECDLKETQMPPLQPINYTDADGNSIYQFSETSHPEVGTITVKIKVTDEAKK